MRHIINSQLTTLRTIYQAAGFDIRVVGGAVRDLIMGKTPKDIDLCTDATPEEQIEIYKANGIRYIETGLQHGTISVVLAGEVYEITTLRYETDHDGRHAVVHYTRDWEKDLSRRDLTVNAMAMDFDGQVFDPFNGREDIKNGCVRFVGDASERIQEDYLRILRFFRFYGRIGKTEIDSTTMRAIIKHGHGLSGISKERVWSEMSKIITGNRAGEVLKAMFDLGVHRHIGLPEAEAGIHRLETASKYTSDPVALMVSLLAWKYGHGEMPEPFTTWKMSRDEVQLAETLVGYGFFERAMRDYEALMVLDKVKKEHIVQMAAIAGQPDMVAQIEAWDMPVFPVGGTDMLAKGVSGQAIGAHLKEMKEIWFYSMYAMTKDELMEAVGF